jgi:hypothetical protein
MADAEELAGGFAEAHAIGNVEGRERQFAQGVGIMPSGITSAVMVGD